MAINRYLPMLAALLFVAMLIAGCGDVRRTASPVTTEQARSIHVIGTGWHTGLVVSRADVSAAGRVPERAAFPDARFLEFGWGDREYYPSPRPTLGMALGAAFASTASVVHLAGYGEEPARRYPDAEVVALPLDAASLDRLVAAIDRTFDRKGEPLAEVVAPGLYRDSHFYPAHGRFSLSNTCNTWVARTLSEAGFELSPRGVVTASDLMGRVRALPGATVTRAP